MKFQKAISVFVPVLLCIALPACATKTEPPSPLPEQIGVEADGVLINKKNAIF